MQGHHFTPQQQTQQWDVPFGILTSLCLVFSYIFNQAACLLHPMKPYHGNDFPYQHFLSAAYLDVTELFQSWISEVLQSRRYYKRYTS